MKVYLAKFEKNGQTAYKIGHTKWFKSIKRFEEEQYNVFDNVSIVDDIYIEHRDARVARLCCELIEATLQGLYPKNFKLEEHFKTEDNMFDQLSGITEFFIIDQSEEDRMITKFKQVNNKVSHIVRKYNGK